MGVALLSPSNGLIIGLDSEEGEKATVVGFDEGFEIGGFALFQLGAELVHVPRGFVLVVAKAIRGFVCIEIEDARG